MVSQSGPAPDHRGHIPTCGHGPFAQPPLQPHQPVEACALQGRIPRVWQLAVDRRPHLGFTLTRETEPLEEAPCHGAGDVGT